LRIKEQETRLTLQKHDDDDDDDEESHSVLQNIKVRPMTVYFMGRRQF
jgi:hypothetical protein